MKPDLQHLKAALESAEFTMEADPAAHPGLLIWSERTQQVIFSLDRQRPFDSRTVVVNSTRPKTS